MSDTKSKLFKTVAFVAYPITDMKRARAFYEGGLGLAVTANWEDKWIEYDIGEGTLALMGADEKHKPGTGGAMLGLEVVDLDASLADLKAKSIPLEGEPFDTPACRGCIVHDPDHNEIVLHAKK